MTARKIYVGGWFQRTLLHLIEMYDFLLGEESPLEGLDNAKLQQLRNSLEIDSVDLKVAGLNHIFLKTKHGIEMKFFEDGLLVLSKRPNSAQEDIDLLTDFYENKLSPAINYLFSLGAPVPKELASIKTVYPYFVVLENASSEDIKLLWEGFGEEKYLAIEQKDFEIYRGDKLYVINNLNVEDSAIEDLVHEQIFFREFEGHMHRYLNIHRAVWEKIADVKERGQISGNEIAEFKGKIDSYAKTISLIEGRINQMDTYIDTRKRMAKEDRLLAELEGELQFKYDTLEDTLEYMKDLWNTTQRYVTSAEKLFTDLSAKSTEASVNNLAIITAMGVGATLIELFIKPELPEFSWWGAIYFLVLAGIGITADKAIKYIYSRKKYSVSEVELAKDL